MKVIKATTDEKLKIIDLDPNNIDDFYNEIGGFEVVRTEALRRFFNEPVVMVVDDNGYAHGKDYNSIASAFYGGDIVGDVIFVPEWNGEFTVFDDIWESFDHIFMCLL